ncbi:putative F-box protein At1g46984 [Silene latifolia]|uniref:putative F-box protein At1g46984 n=1 Tax=Silene latifolia TaxID=37657 RepID=UPI003D78B1DD
MNVEQKIEGGVKRRKCHTSNASITNIPEELQIVILSRLPPKVLSRCQYVCKHWNTTLTIQAFMLRHSRSYDEHSKLAFVAHWTSEGSNSILSYEFLNNNSPANTTRNVPKTTKMCRVVKNIWTMEVITEEVIIGHHERFTVVTDALLNGYMSNICNDLICHNGYISTNVGLLNIKTQDFIHLPAITTKGSKGRIAYWYALGFDPESKVYKVLSIYGGKEGGHTKAAILTVGSKHWKPVEYEFLRFWRRNNMFCLDGVIYWVNDYEIHGASVVHVVAFDLNREVFRDYMLDTIIPIKDNVETIKYYLTSLKGNPTLFIWQKYTDEIQQLTLFNHKNPKATWNRRSFIAHDFPKDFPYGCHRTWVAGGSILLDIMKPINIFLIAKEQDNPLCKWYDLENLAVDQHISY